MQPVPTARVASAAKISDMHMFNDGSADVAPSSDESILESFIACGCDLLAPFFPEQDHLRLRLRIVAEVTFADEQFWQEIGHTAFESLTKGLGIEWGDLGARAWARLLERALRKLCRS